MSTRPNARSAAARNVEEIARLEHGETQTLSRAERGSIAITSAVGTFTCAVVHIVLLAGWCAWNSFAPEGSRFDPYPFGLLTMFVSMEGVMLAILVLITQNRMSEQTDRRDHLDLQVNLLAEQEMTMVLRMLSRISDHLGVAPDDRDRAQARELMEQTNIYELMDELRRKFP
jgi:uncharacterized membrane protein